MNKHSIEQVQMMDDDELDQELFDQRYERNKLTSTKEKACLHAYIKVIEAEIAQRDYEFYYDKGE